MKLIGVTGSFGSGKTTVTKFFRKLGAKRVVDADKIVHGLYKKKSVKKEIVKHFGGEILTVGRIDRKKLAARAFSGKKELKALCDIIYPETIKEIKREAGKRGEGFAVLDAPMLLEAGLGDYVDYVVVVRADRKKLFKRCAGLGFKKDEVLRRLSFQMPLRGKLKHADFVVNNNRSKEYTIKEVKKIWEELIGGRKDG